MLTIRCAFRSLSDGSNDAPLGLWADDFFAGADPAQAVCVYKHIYIPPPSGDKKYGLLCLLASHMQPNGFSTGLLLRLMLGSNVRGRYTHDIYKKEKHIYIYIYL